MPDADPVTREAYTHEVISFGFWAGDKDVREPTYYSYTLPEPAGLRDRPLAPPQAFWADQGSGSLARSAVRGRPRPRAIPARHCSSSSRARTKQGPTRPDGTGWA